MAKPTHMPEITLITTKLKHLMVSKKTMESLSSTSGFCFQFCDETAFTSHCHETSLWSSATWPTVLTQSRGDCSRGIVANPPSSPRVLFVPTTSSYGGEQTAAAWPASTVRQETPHGSHHQLQPPDLLTVCQDMKAAALRTGGCPGA